MTIIEAIKAVDYEDVAKRATWTFVQTFLAVIFLASDSIITPLFNGDWTGLVGVIVGLALGGVASGLSAVKTIVLEVVRQIKVKAEL